MNKWILDKRLPVWIIICFTLILNINTLANQYAMDDEPIILNNLYVQDGVSGIGKIMSSDAFQSYYDQRNAASPLGGGRYRPLSIVSFALEQQVFGTTGTTVFVETQQEVKDLQMSGKNPVKLKELSLQLGAIAREILADNMRLAPIRHAFQLMFFILAVIALHHFLSKYLLPNQPLIAFIAVMLFIFHPVHTEVIANLKSRDEIFSLLFLSLAFSAFFRYIEEQRSKDLYLGAGTLLLALLSKEYALLFFILLPVGVMLRYGKGLEVLRSRWALTAMGVTLVFICIRAAIVSANGGAAQDPELLNDPFLYATTAQKIATKIYLLNQYLRLLFFPQNLSYDYSFNTFPYVGFADYHVWLSVVAWGSISAIGILLWIRRHILAFAFALFLGPFMLVNNLLFDIGATMGERLIFHSSIGFCIIVAWLLVKGAERISLNERSRKLIVFGLMVLICAPMGYKVVARNANWKNNYTLQTHDVRVVPNSAAANANAGSQYFNEAYNTLPPDRSLTDAERNYLKPHAEKGIFYLTRALAIYPGFLIARLNRGICYVNAGKLDSAAYDWIVAAKQYHTRNPALVKNANILYEKGRALGARKDYDNAIKYFRLSTQVDSENAMLWENLGGALFMTGHLEEATSAFSQALKIDPQLQNAINGRNAVQMRINELKTGIK